MCDRLPPSAEVRSSGKSTEVSSPNDRTPRSFTPIGFTGEAERDGSFDQTGLPDDLNQSLCGPMRFKVAAYLLSRVAGRINLDIGVEDDLQEALVCFDAATGKVLWERRHSDFVSDIVYNRYGVGQPA